MSTPPSMSCPSGGTFYACLNDSKFVGCCASNACGSTGCPAENLYAASFESSQYGQYSDQECDAGQFWTRRDTTPPFWGCFPLHQARELQQPHESREKTTKQEPTTPPSYATNERERQRPASELPGSTAECEMESGQSVKRGEVERVEDIGIWGKLKGSEMKIKKQ
ncbi:uncharacterized protein MYCFIDRAFT_76937 [Pseudocercospora fijiensis CIRAD86]|uniref:Uncharacterized protein n=1 Tax=Pseudocercospora fijiensis (strain CIRAD86) TaxID=383855 RepID=M3AU30_PSEFD|nr:uncharacterized protein MYCFIDRAFT_76937 [Pseudocercospora fijiensis CIRAD86]EME80997.1 hypothetical protein MYCFIDRAFT_76937 [Pseudocercospora fijiensis CIRAD86]